MSDNSERGTAEGMPDEGKPKITKPPSSQTDRELLKNIVELQKAVDGFEKKLNSGENLDPKERQAMTETTKKLDASISEMTNRPNKEQLVSKLEQMQRPPTVRSVPDRSR